MTEKLNILSPKAIDIGTIGGWGSIQPSDIAAALSGLSPAPYYLGMFIYARDPAAFEKLYIQVAGMDGIPTKPEALKGARPVRNILELALDELWGNNKCRDCGGAGCTNDQRQCKTCRGRKYKVYTDLSRAKQARIPFEHWKRYKGFYERLYQQLTDYNAQIRTHLIRRLGVDEVDA